MGKMAQEKEESNGYAKDVTEGNIPILSTEAEAIKRKGVSTQNLFDAQSMMNNPKPTGVRSYISKLKHFPTNHYRVDSEGRTQLLVDGSYMALSEVVFNNPQEHGFLLLAHLASIDLDKDLCFFTDSSTSEGTMSFSSNDSILHLI